MTTAGVNDEWRLADLAVHRFALRVLPAVTRRRFLDELLLIRQAHMTRSAIWFFDDD